MKTTFYFSVLSALVFAPAVFAAPIAKSGAVSVSTNHNSNGGGLAVATASNPNGGAGVSVLTSTGISGGNPVSNTATLSNASNQKNGAVGFGVSTSDSSEIGGSPNLAGQTEQAGAGAFSLENTAGAHLTVAATAVNSPGSAGNQHISF